MSYREFFERLTGFPPHPYQERLADELLNGNSVIMRVPTGGGKTWAAVAPFLYALSSRRPFADRLLYALPLRSLASSLHATVYEKMSGCFGNVLERGKDREYANRARYCSLQIGSQKNDPFFESDLIFTTIDQLLSAYVFIPVSLPNRLGNINAGSLLIAMGAVFRGQSLMGSDEDVEIPEPPAEMRVPRRRKPGASEATELAVECAAQQLT